MKREAVGIVKDGRIHLPPEVSLPDGITVHVFWEESPDLTEVSEGPEPEVTASIAWSLRTPPGSLD